MACARSGIPDNSGRDNIGYNESKKMKHSNGSFFSDQKTSSFRRCKICNGKHGIWSCEVFQRMDINNKWNAVKKEKLCFCCLGDDHYSKDCKRRRKS